MSDGWEASDDLINYILEQTKEGDTVLELGSGESTRRFIEAGRKVITVEHDPVWLNKVSGATYLHAPIKLYDDKYRPLPSIKKRIHEHKGWYDYKVLEALLRDKLYNIIMVDGPPRDFGRSGFLHHLGIFPTLNCPIVFDDLHRLDDLYTAQKVANNLRRNFLIFNNGEITRRQKANGDWSVSESKPFGVVLM